MQTKAKMGLAQRPQDTNLTHSEKAGLQNAVFKSEKN